jgi:predicted transcriptional regulator
MERKLMTEVFKVRITPALKEAIQAEADRLNVRPADVARMALAERVDPSRETQPTAAVAAT